MTGGVINRGSENRGADNRSAGDRTAEPPGAERRSAGNRSTESRSAATRILTEEHRLIERGLDCLVAVVSAARRDGRLDATTAGEALALVSDFADRCHHGKEEDRLFPAMRDAGLEQDGGVLAMMRDEHESGREHARAMAASLDGAAAGDPRALAAFATHAGELDSLLRTHIAKEDQVLFPLGDELLDGAATAALLADFHRVESDAGGGRHTRWIERLDDLCRACSIEPLRRSALPTLEKEFL
jgi:hemerythrin-like domain-containing protein